MPAERGWGGSRATNSDDRHDAWKSGRWRSQVCLRRLLLGRQSGWRYLRWTQLVFFFLVSTFYLGKHTTIKFTVLTIFECTVQRQPPLPSISSTDFIFSNWSKFSFSPPPNPRQPLFILLSDSRSWTPFGVWNKWEHSVWHISLKIMSAKPFSLREATQFPSFIFLIIFIYVYVCASVWIYNTCVWVRVGTFRGQKMPHLLELELQVVLASLPLPPGAGNWTPGPLEKQPVLSTPHLPRPCVSCLKADWHSVVWYSVPAPCLSALLQGRTPVLGHKLFPLNTCFQIWCCVFGSEVTGSADNSTVMFSRSWWLDFHSTCNWGQGLSILHQLISSYLPLKISS